MAKFELDEVEQARAEEFRQWYRKEYGERFFKKAQFEFVMGCTGIGTYVVIQERNSEVEKDITNYDAW